MTHDDVRVQATMARAIEVINELMATSKSVRHDPRSLALARTHFETAMLWLTTAVSGGGVIDG